MTPGLDSAASRPDDDRDRDSAAASGRAAEQPPATPTVASPPILADDGRLRIALDIAGADGKTWASDFRHELPDAVLTRWPEADPDAKVAVVWKPTQAFFDAHPAVTAIFNLGAGVDALTGLELPRQARVYRLEDAGMAEQMVEYVLHALLRHMREFDRYDEDGRDGGRWQVRQPRRPRDFPVGILGTGVLGARIGQAISALGFEVHGWSRSGAPVEGLTCHAGAEGLDDFLGAVRVLVCALPLTPATENILDRHRLSQLQRPGYLINIARGGHLVDEDLVALIDEGQLAGACLDVFRVEPLPPDHLLRRRRAITITPHISAQTLAEEAVAQVVDKLRILEAGGQPGGAVDLERGY